ncbi:hypothetical protein DY000_02031002 [Brassica cretica]|uniref:Uncharacterized protein n=1 Tax=Brassica cretica TaxID=69181 RepID=A0ABQ7DUM8_BRACR|nr:hypothetical protein DY000_02031002 [Brassica cretica]
MNDKSSLLIEMGTQNFIFFKVKVSREFSSTEIELRLEPRPDDRTDRTGARLPRPTRHSKTHGRARLSLGRKETEDGHAFSFGGPSGQSCKRPYLYPVHPSGSDEPGHYLKGHL